MPKTSRRRKSETFGSTTKRKSSTPNTSFTASFTSTNSTTTTSSATPSTARTTPYSRPSPNPKAKSHLYQQLQIPPKPSPTPSSSTTSRLPKSKPKKTPRDPWKLQKTLYPNLGKPLSQNNYVGCDCRSASNPSAACQPGKCSCLRDGSSCRQSCMCGPACSHQFPACNCKGGKCGSNCPCWSFYFLCGGGCSCFGCSGSGSGSRGSRLRAGDWKGGLNDEQTSQKAATTTSPAGPSAAGGCLSTSHLPKTEIRESGVPAAGRGLFASQPIPKRTIIGVLEGVIEPNPSEPDFDVFEVADGISLRCHRSGIYFANERAAHRANAEFRYLEGSRRREMVLISKKDIRAGDEIFAQYTAAGSEPLYDVGARAMWPPDEGEYALVLGEGAEGPEELWVAKILRVRDRDFDVQWLIQPGDLDWIAEDVRRDLVLRPGEHVMCRGWTQRLAWENFVRTVSVKEGVPERERMNRNTWWWTRTYDAVRQRMVEPKVKEKGIGKDMSKSKARSSGVGNRREKLAGEDDALVILID